MFGCSWCGWDLQLLSLGLALLASADNGHGIIISMLGLGGFSDSLLRGPCAEIRIDSSTGLAVNFTEDWSMMWSPNELLSFTLITVACENTVVEWPLDSSVHGGT